MEQMKFEMTTDKSKVMIINEKNKEFGNKKTEIRGKELKKLQLMIIQEIISKNLQFALHKTTHTHQATKQPKTNNKLHREKTSLTRWHQKLIQSERTEMRRQEKLREKQNDKIEELKMNGGKTQDEKLARD